MKLIEITKMDPKLIDLKQKLLKPGNVEIANAAYARDLVALGDVQAIGAGVITRRMDRHQNKTFGFHYGTHIGKDPILANIIVGNRILKPGDEFEDDN